MKKTGHLESPSDLGFSKRNPYSGSREGISQNLASVQVGQASSNAPSNNSQVDKENPGLSSSVDLNPNTSLAVGDSATLISGNQTNYDMH